jgi:hypothetical protein
MLQVVVLDLLVDPQLLEQQIGVMAVKVELVMEYLVLPAVQVSSSLLTQRHKYCCISTI